MNQNGKGDKPRPPSVDKEQYDKNWDKTFPKTEKILKEIKAK